MTGIMIEGIERGKESEDTCRGVEWEERNGENVTEEAE